MGDRLRARSGERPGPLSLLPALRRAEELAIRPIASHGKAAREGSTIRNGAAPSGTVGCWATAASWPTACRHPTGEGGSACSYFWLAVARSRIPNRCIPCSLIRAHAAQNPWSNRTSGPIWVWGCHLAPPAGHRWGIWGPDRSTGLQHLRIRQRAVAYRGVWGVGLAGPYTSYAAPQPGSL